MGEVCLAEDTEPKRRVALKFISPKKVSNWESRGRFKRREIFDTRTEAQILLERRRIHYNIKRLHSSPVTARPHRRQFNHQLA